MQKVDAKLGPDILNGLVQHLPRQTRVIPASAGIQFFLSMQALNSFVRY